MRAEQQSTMQRLAMFMISLRSFVSRTLCMPYLAVSVVCRPTKMLAAFVPLPSCTM